MATVNKVTNAFGKVSKFRLSARIPFLLRFPNNITPIIEYRYSKSNKSPPTLAKAGIV